MGYIRHDAIVVTGSDYNSSLADARDKAIELGLLCSPIVDGAVNGYLSFLIAPDGSKEGWDHSHEAEAARTEWIKWVRAEHPYLNWAHVSFGGDDSELAHLNDWNEKEPTP